MPALTYDEDVSFGVDLDEDDVRRCTDVETLLGWDADADAVIEDIKAQIQASALGGVAERAWVYRAGKAMGFMSRARSRIRTRLLALGYTSAAKTQEIAKLHAAIAEAKARSAVALEFLRLSEEGAIADRTLFARIEKRAVELVAARDAETARKAAKHADHQRKVA